MAKASDNSETESALPEPAKIFLDRLLVGDAPCINYRVKDWFGSMDRSLFTELQLQE